MSEYSLSRIYLNLILECEHDIVRISTRQKLGPLQTIYNGLLTF